MECNRRRYLSTALTTTAGLSLAGCSDILGGDGDGGPQYESEQREAMLLTVDDFPSGWQRNDELNDNFDAIFLNGDGSIVVMTMVEISEEVSAAKDRMENARAGVSDPNEYTIGDDSFWATRNNEIACTIFRHSNAVGQACALRESGAEVVPDQSRSQDYATTMYNQWQEL